MSRPAESEALQTSKEMLLRFSVDPTRTNLAPYRHASRELERATASNQMFGEGLSPVTPARRERASLVPLEQGKS
jgi:alkylhydroperoxidase family enzyme